MNQILALQTLEPIGYDLLGFDVDALGASTCSLDGGCGCSATSWSGCSPNTNVAITQ
ncbi:MAG TPA: hypothetical protein VGQ46_17125 [Thermoanaerobaculia bacterium]|jgi:hypothetical protein|nr:hypothetical protein [Thermoanaerobaculia bacterium]